MSVRSNPRLLIFYFILAGLPAVSLFLYARLPQLAGAAVLGLSFFLDYKLFRSARPYLKTKIVTEESSVTIFLAGQEATFPWTEVALSGKCNQTGGKPFLFLYHLKEDKIITVPYEYTDMPGLENTLAERTHYEVFQLLPGMDVRKILHDRFHPDQDMG
jgi:hypothetical protein